MKKNLLKLTVLMLIFSVLLPCVFAGTEIVSSVVSKMADTSADGAFIEGEYVKNIPIGATAKDVLAQISGAAYITMHHGYKIADATRVGTGYKLVTSSGESYTLLVNGDINGDSYITGKDLVRAKKHLVSGNYGEYGELLDVNGDGTFNQNDLISLTDSMVETEVEFNLADSPAADLGEEFYATIDLSYADNSLTAQMNSNVASETKGDSTRQIWRFTRNPNGTYLIRNLALGTALEVPYSSTEPGVNVSLYDMNNNANQRWHLIECDGGYIFRSECGYDRVIDVFEASAESGANVQMYGWNDSQAQVFRINKVGDIDVDSADFFDQVGPLDIPMFYANLSFGKTDIATDTNGNVCVKTSKPFWKFELQDNGTYKITSAANGKALDVAEGKAANGTNIQVYDSNDTQAQRWYVYLKNGKATVCSALDKDFVVDVYSGADTDGCNVHLYTYNGTAAQQFKIADYTTELPQFLVTCPYNQVVYGRYSTFDEAKAAAKGYLGYLVYDLSGTLLYNPCPSISVAKILYHAKLNADYMRVNGYTYGDADVNPALDKTEKVVSCDRFVGWTLYDAGYNRNNQPATKGYTLYGPLENLLISLGFQKHTNLADVRAGDIIFVGYSYNLAVPSNYKSYPCHVFIAASNYDGGNSYRYDGGSPVRINSVQPSYEPLSYPNTQFRFAYRAP